MNILIAIPLFIIAHQNLIELNWIFNLDRILLFLLMIVVVHNTKALTDHYHYMYIYIHPGFILGQLLEIMDSTVYLKIMILCYTRCPIIQIPRYNNC
jgi:hypothetical protein